MSATHACIFFTLFLTPIPLLFAATFSCSAQWTGTTDNIARKFTGEGPSEVAAFSAALNLCRDFRPMDYCSKGYGNRTCHKLPGEDGPTVEFCVPPTSMGNPKWTSEVRQLFGERTLEQQACIQTAPGQRIKRVSCHMYNGYALDAANHSIADRLKQPSCGAKFYNTSNCMVSYAAVQKHTSIIDADNRHIVCAGGNAEKGTGARGWFIVGE